MHISFLAYKLARVGIDDGSTGTPWGGGPGGMDARARWMGLDIDAAAGYTRVMMWMRYGRSHINDAPIPATLFNN